MVYRGFVVIMSIGSSDRRRGVVTAALAVAVVPAGISATPKAAYRWAAEIDARSCYRDIECD